MATHGPIAWHRFETLDAACEALAETVALRLRDCLAKQERASLAVPGGTTPAPFLKALGDHDLDWARVTMMPTDERFVAADDEASNERMIRSVFAPLRDGRVRFLSFHDHGSDLEAAASVLASLLAGEPPLDILVSGMGADGHVASLFPGAEASYVGVPDCGIVAARPSHLPTRLSLSPVRLTGAGWASLLISSDAKEAVLKGADQRAAPLPVDLLLARAQGLDVYWAKG